ncbi:MAG TPA: substrate-binding domain-containing protein [Edaphocola sp.]|nr:substrate-binding domain-containing protein [Edaphocola sp.]
MKKTILNNIFLATVLFMVACNNQPSSVSKESMEAYTSGKLTLAVDESFKPVMVQEVKVFDSSYPNTQFDTLFLPESEVMQQLFDGKAQMIITTRDISPEEKKRLEAKEIFVRSMAFAKDGIAVIVNNESEDKKMTTGMVSNILQGKFARKYQIIFDNKNGSIARYVSDSILKGASLSPDVFAVKNSDEVIDYVSKNKDAMGFIGMSQAFDPEASTGYGSFKKNITVVPLTNDTMNKFVLPYQAPIALKQYPYSRKIYFISRIESNLATGFANFITSEQGQLIINKAKLVPLNVSLEIRDVEIKP